MATENYNDDLEYLARQGFEKVEVSDSDLNELKRRIRGRRILSGRFYFGLGSLLLGTVLGIALFFVFFSKPDPDEGVQPQKQMPTAPLSAPATTLTTQLDTITVVKENFVNPQSGKKKVARAVEKEPALQNDPADVIVSKPLDLNLLHTDLKEEKLKYIINSPVFYLHDMKITNYTTLYFRKNHFVRFTGTPADLDKADNKSVGSNLKQSADYYLHEEIATAMLQFKKGKYDQVIPALKTVASYNDEDLNCDFYLAMCYYYKKNYQLALPLFDRCMSNTNNTFLQESQYYKALALYENGSKEEARALFKHIAEEETFYSDKAKAYLNN